MAGVDVRVGPACVISVVLTVQVPEKKLKQVMADKELYKVCAVEVKRQIWQDNQALFGDEVSPLLKQYIVEKEAALFSSDLSILHNFFSPSPKTRRQGEVRPPPCRLRHDRFEPLDKCEPYPENCVWCL